MHATIKQHAAAMLLSAESAASTFSTKIHTAVKDWYLERISMINQTSSSYRHTCADFSPLTKI